MQISIIGSYLINVQQPINLIKEIKPIEPIESIKPIEPEKVEKQQESAIYGKSSIEKKKIIEPKITQISPMKKETFSNYQLEESVVEFYEKQDSKLDNANIYDSPKRNGINSSRSLF